MQLAGRQPSRMSVRRKMMKGTVKKIGTSAFVLFYAICFAPMGQAYSFDMIVPDVWQPAGISGASACPVRTHRLTAAGSLAVRWSSTLNTNPVAIVTQNQTASGRLAEIEQVIAQALAVWTGASGTTLVPVTLTPLTRTATQNACGPDGVNSICFDQADMAFTPGVLAFTRVISTDRLGVQVGSSAVSTQLGQILDADIYFNPSDSRTAFATPQALAAAPTAYDFESVLTYELGHFLGSSHSAAWGAIMFPFATAPGTFSGMRPTMQQPDAPLGDDDRNGSARSLCRPGGRGAQRIDQRSHFSRESTGAPGLASGRDGRFRRASGRRGCDERRSCGSDDRRVELHGSWPRAI